VANRNAIRLMNRDEKVRRRGGSDPELSVSEVERVQGGRAGLNMGSLPPLLRPRVHPTSPLSKL